MWLVRGMCACAQRFCRVCVLVVAGPFPGCSYNCRVIPRRGDVLWSECGCTLSLLSGLYLFSVLEVSNQDSGPQHLTGTG